MNLPLPGILATFLALGFTLLSAPCVQAEEDPKKVETFTVTGSNIQSSDPAGSTPITRIGSDEILFQGTTRVEDMLRSYPQVYVTQGSGESLGAVGTATMELRALGTQRTLVLVNGRRMPAGSPRDGGIAPDINQIPGALIKHVDILTGGASAVYGSDAIAGVVNFILVDDFEGLRADFQYSEYQHHNDSDHWRDIITASGYPVADGYKRDGEIAQASLTAGFNFTGNRGNITAYATYRDTEPVLQGDRDYSSCALNASTTRCLGSYVIPEGNFFDAGLAPLAAFRDRNNLYVGGPSFDYLVEGHSFVDWLGETYNFAPPNYFQRSDERYTLGAFAHYGLNDRAEVYAEFMYMHDRTTAQIAPSGNFHFTRTLRCAHPFLSEQQRDQIRCLDENGELIANGQQVVFIGRRNVEGGPRRNELIHASYRGVLGMRGDLSDFWDYDAFVQYAKVEMRNVFSNILSPTRIRRSIDAVSHNGEAVCRSALPDTSGAVEDPGCVPWNIFKEGAVTQEMLDYLTIPLRSKGATDQLVTSVTFSGDLTPYGVKSPLAAHSVSVALGGTFRKESLQWDLSQYFREGRARAPAVSGDYHVAELFAEAHVPLIEDAEYVQELVLDAAYRYSDYEYGEYVDTWAFRLGWAVNPIVRIRGGVQRAVRAPSVHELFSPERFDELLLLRDPCSGNIGGTRNPDGSFTGGISASRFTFEQCARTGVTAAQWGKIPNPSDFKYNLKRGGNPNLSPEEAKTWTAGIVFTPEFANGLQLAVDYYKIEIEGGITGLSALFILRQCLSDSGNHALCDRIVRGIAGDLWIGSNVDGERCTGQEPDLSNCVSGHVVSVQDNLALERTNGVDVTLDLALNIGTQGELRLNNVLTHINALDIQAVDGAPVRRCAGTRYCGPTPDLQNRLRVTWDTPWDVTTSIMWRYTSAVESGNRFDVDIPKMNYLDLAAVWQVADNAKIYAGINNLADREPPIVGNHDDTNGNTYPGLYDALGRYLFMGASMEF